MVILQALRYGEVELSALVERLGSPARVLSQRLYQLQRKGLIERKGLGVYTLTEAGKAALK